MGPSSGVSWEQLPWFRLLGVSAWLLWGPGKRGADRPEHAVALEGHTDGVPPLCWELAGARGLSGEHVTLRPRGGCGAWGCADQAVARAPGSGAPQMLACNVTLSHVHGSWAQSPHQGLMLCLPFS